jgi:hypothetical protein
VKVGGPKLAQARKVTLETIVATVDNHAANVLPIIRNDCEQCARQGAELKSSDIVQLQVPLNASIKRRYSSANLVSGSAIHRSNALPRRH